MTCPIVLWASRELFEPTSGGVVWRCWLELERYQLGLHSTGLCTGCIPVGKVCYRPVLTAEINDFDRIVGSCRILVKL